MTTEQVDARSEALEGLCLARFWYYITARAHDYGDGTDYVARPLWRYLTSYLDQVYGSTDNKFNLAIHRGYEIEWREDIEDQFAGMAERITRELQSRCDEHGFAVSVRVEAIDHGRVRHDVTEHHDTYKVFGPLIHYTKTTLCMSFHEPDTSK